MANQEDKNIAIFAHYDKHNIIDDYVLIYLQNIKKFCSKIIFVSDGTLSHQEQQKISKITNNIIAKKHQEYDFGSWKLGFNFLKEKYPQDFTNTNKLIFANDSCYCISKFDSLFAQIDKMPEIDCFGITDSKKYGDYTQYIDYHLQSYFLVFQNNLFKESFFNDFMQNITKETDKVDIIVKYEVGLSKTMSKNNKKLFAIFGKDILQDYADKNKASIKKKTFKIIGLFQKIFGIRRIYRTLFKITDCYSYRNPFYLLILKNCPLFKKAIVVKDFNNQKFLNTSSLCYFWKKIIDQETNFDSKIISDHCNRILK